MTRDALTVRPKAATGCGGTGPTLFPLGRHLPAFFFLVRHPACPRVCVSRVNKDITFITGHNG